MHYIYHLMVGGFVSWQGQEIFSVQDVETTSGAFPYSGGNKVLDGGKAVRV